MTQHGPTRWWMRAAGAGLAAASLGVGVGTLQYRALPGTAAMDWSMMAVALVGFAVLTGVLSGVGIGAGTVAAMRMGGARARPSAVRLVAMGALGGIAGCAVPAFVGIAGFGSLRAPYAGTGNLVFGTLLVCTTFVALWAPMLRGGYGRLGRATHFGIAAMASGVAVASLGIFAVSIVSTLGMVPSAEEILAVAQRVGVVSLAASGSVGIGAAAGGTAGFGCWLYLECARVLERRAG